MIAIRQCSTVQQPEVAALRRAWVEENVGRPIADEDYPGRFAAWAEAEAGRRVTFLAEQERDPIGMMNLALFERMPAPGRPDSRWAYLGNAFVLAGYRDRGVGTALLDAVLDHARCLGAARVVLSPSPRSVAFYRRAGFGPASMLLAMPLSADGAQP